MRGVKYAKGQDNFAYFVRFVSRSIVYTLHARVKNQTFCFLVVLEKAQTRARKTKSFESYRLDGRKREFFYYNKGHLIDFLY